jgi:glycolate oxidase FAD binding subunit
MPKREIRPSQSTNAAKHGLFQILGADRASTDEAVTAQYKVDGFTPALVAQPSDQQTLVDVMRWAASERAALTPWGGGTKQGLCRPLKALDVVIRTDALDSILEIDEGNLTAEVEAGLSLAALQSELKPRRLFFALDPLDGAAATIGGVLATNASGPRRLLYRTARDQVLGFEAILPNGETFHAGGKTVKDVAGYNLTKLMLGGWGTLGVFARATLRLQPLPDQTAVVSTLMPDAEKACGLALKVRGSELLPSAIELCNESTWQSGTGRSEARVLFLVEGQAEQVKRMLRQLQAMSNEAGAQTVTACEGDEAEQVWAQRLAIPEVLREGQGFSARIKVSLPLSSLVAFLITAQRDCAQAELDFAYTAHAGNGICHAFLRGEGSQVEERITSVFKNMQGFASTVGGFALLEAAPLEVRLGVDPLPPRDDYMLMRRIRESISPFNTINPGKLV